MSDATARATFTSMDESGKEDWTVIRREFEQYAQRLPDRVLQHLRLLAGDFGGFPIDRLQHSLQTATRAYRAGESEHFVVMALLHDIGDTLGSYNHPEVAAAIMGPFLTEDLVWIAANHGVFQSFHYFHHMGADRHLREKFRGHPNFEACARFCEIYDQSAFDPAYDTATLEFFTPMVNRVFSKPRRSLLNSAMQPVSIS